MAKLKKLHSHLIKIKPKCKKKVKIFTLWNNMYIIIIIIIYRQIPDSSGIIKINTKYHHIHKNSPNKLILSFMLP